jgi:hypothetical protein
MGFREFDFDATPAALRYVQDDASHPTNSYYGPTGADIVSSTGTPTVGDLYAFPFYSGPGGKIDQVGFNVTTGGSAGAKARCGIYASDTSGLALVPGALLVDGGEFDATLVQADITTLASPLVFNPNQVYWLAFICGTAAPTVTTFTSGWHLFGRNASFNAQFGWQKVGQGYGALPTTFPASPGVCTSAAALVVVRFATYNRLKCIQP